MSQSSEQARMAVLDDYASIAMTHFGPLQDNHNIQIDTFPSTITSITTDSTAHQQLIDRLKPYRIISTMRERTSLPSSILTELPNLKLLLTTGMRNASIDTAACKERGITLVGTSGKPNGVPGHEATNEMTWALILGLAKQIPRGDRVVQSGDVATNDPNRETGGWQTHLTFGLAGKTLGLLGLGKLGCQAGVTGILGFGMKVIAWSSSLTQARAEEMAASRGLPKGSFVVVGSKKELCEKADVLSVHYVLSDRSRGLIGREELAVMKPNSLLINTSRGPLIDEAALLETLEKGKIRGAALDVFDTEPIPRDSRWRREGYWGEDGRSQVVLSPHMGYVEEETMHSWYEQQCRAVESWMKGEDVKGVIS